MKRHVSLFFSLLTVMSLLCGLLAFPAAFAAEEPDPLAGFDDLPDDPFSGNYSEFEGKDGSKTLVYDNGSVMTQYKDGSTSSVDYKGNLYSTAPDGSCTVRTKGGSSATEHADGRKSWTTPDGKTTTVNPDGSSSETFSNGLTKEYDTEGGLVGIGFADGKERIGTDEHGDYKDGRIKGPNGASMEVSDGGNSIKITTPDGTRYEYTSTGIADSEGGRREITTITKPDGTSSTVTETSHVNRDENGRTTGSIESTVKEILVDGNKYQSEYITEYDPNGNPVYNPQNVTQFTGSDGSTYWTDNNSKAVEYRDPNTGERFCLDAKGNIVDYAGDDVNVKAVYDTDGNVVSSEWDWKDGAKYTVSGGTGVFVTPDGKTYTTDGKGNVFENGQQIKKDGKWIGGTKGSSSSDANDSKVENPLSDYYTDDYKVEVTTGGYVSDPKFSQYWSVNTFNIYVTEIETDDSAANGSGTVLIGRPSLSAPSSYANVCGRMEDMSGWPAKKVNDIVSLYASQKSFDGTGTLPGRGAAYAYDYYGDQYLEVIYDSYLPVNNVPNVYIEYSLGFEFSVDTTIEDALKQIEPYDDAAKKVRYSVEWDCRILKKPKDAKKDKNEDDKEKIPRGFVDPVGYFALSAGTTKTELQNMMYTVDEYYLVPVNLNTYGSYIYDIARNGDIPFDASPVAVDGKTKYTIRGAASGPKGTDTIELTLTNFGRRGSFYKIQADVSGSETVTDGDDIRQNKFDKWWSSSWNMDNGAPNTSITFTTLLTDDGGKEYPSKYMATITFRIAGIKPTKRSEAYLAEHDIKSIAPTESGDDGLPETVGGIIGVSLLTALIGGAAGAIASTAGSITGAVMGEAGAAAAEAVGSGLSGADFGPHIRMDGDGDLNVRDPATGEERLYKSNGDGTYTNPMTGATYTPEELKDSLASREENADLIRQDEAVRKEAVSAQAEDNKNVSFYDAEAKAEKAAAEKEEEHERFKDKMYFKHGAEEGDDKAVKKDILEKANAEYADQAKYEARAEYANAGYETAKETKQAADIAIDVMAEIDQTGMGKVVKDGYAVASSAAGNVGEVMAGEKTMGAAIAQTAVDSAAELAKNHTDSVAGKYAANIFGDSAKEMSKEALKGGSLEDIRKAGEKGAISGAANATIDTVFDGAGKFASAAMKDGGKAIGKAFGEEITKETAANAVKTAANDAVKNSISDDD